MTYRNYELGLALRIAHNLTMEKFYYPLQAEEMWHYLSQEKAQVEITIKRAKMSRTLAQNRLLWAWMTEISRKYAESYGDWHSKETWYQYFAEMFLNVDVVMIKDRPVKLKASTSDLEVGAFSEFLDNIEMYCVTEFELHLTRTRDYLGAHNG